MIKHDDDDVFRNDRYVRLAVGHYSSYLESSWPLRCIHLADGFPLVDLMTGDCGRVGPTLLLVSTLSSLAARLGIVGRPKGDSEVN